MEYMMSKVRSFSYLLKSETIKEYSDFKHYFVNYIVGIFNQAILCYVLAMGFLEPGADFFDFLVKIFIWYIGRDLIAELPASVQEERSHGTLEYIYLNVHRMETYLFVKTISTILWSLLFYIALATILIGFGLFDSKEIIFNFESQKLLVVFFALVACIGYGYFFAGLALILRKISAMVSIFGYLLLFSQFVDTNSKLSWIIFLVPGAWYKFDIGINLMAMLSFATLLLGILLFSFCLKLSTQGGQFWKK